MAYKFCAKGCAGCATTTTSAAAQRLHQRDFSDGLPAINKTVIIFLPDQCVCDSVGAYFFR